MKKKRKNSNTSWEGVSGWYDKLVGKEGHTYHETVILPELGHLLDLDSYEKPSILDLGCGSGILERNIPRKTGYLGLDLSTSLLQAAKKKARGKDHTFIEADITDKFPIKEQGFTHAVAILSLQNLKNPSFAIKEAARFLAPNGKFIAVLNHPCFRIPRQTSWGSDLDRNIQYRRLDRYLSELEIPIQMNPGKGKKSETTLSYHAPISLWTKWFREAGLAVTHMDEWCSNKTSTGGAAKRENRARKEFPLFLVISSTKL